MNRRLALAALSGVSLRTVWAETRQQRGKRVVDEALQALGGDRFLSVKTRLESGRAYSFYRERMTGLAIAKIYTKFQEGGAATDLKQVERQTFGKEEDTAVLFTKDSGYQITFRGARPMTADRVERHQDLTARNIFYILRQRLEEPGMAFDYTQSTVWSNTPVEIVDIVDAENRSVKVYFDRNTKLPVRQVFTRRNALDKQKDEEVSIFAKYRDVGEGVKWPFSIMAERNGEKVFELYSESVTINTPMGDDLFVLPGHIKVLKPEKN